MRTALLIVGYLAVGVAIAALEIRDHSRDEIRGDAPMIGLVVIFWPIVGAVVLLGTLAFGASQLIWRRRP